MKKIFALLTAMTMVFSIGTISMATSSPVAGEGNIESAEDVDGTYEVIVSEAVLNQDELDKLPAAVKDAGGDENSSLEAIELDVEKDGENANAEVTKDNKLKVTFVRTNDNKVVAVLYWNESTKSWDKASFKQDGKTVTVTFNHLCNVIFVLGKAGSTDTPDDGNNSPQTGYDTVIWTVAAASLAACAGFCFFKSKKAA